MLLYINCSFFRSSHQCFYLIKLLTAISENGLCTCMHILYIYTYINIYKKSDKTKVFRKRPIYLFLRMYQRNFQTVSLRVFKTFFFFFFLHNLAEFHCMKFNLTQTDLKQLFSPKINITKAFHIRIYKELGIQNFNYTFKR